MKSEHERNIYAFQREGHYSSGTLTALGGQKASLGQCRGAGRTIQYGHRKGQGLEEQKRPQETDPCGCVEIHDRDGVPSQR